MLEGKVALVTGSARRTGRAILENLAENGADVVVHYNQSEAEALDAVEKARSLGRKAHAARADLTDYKQAQALFDEVYNIFGKLDILINNVGNYLVKDIEQVTHEEWDYQIQTTVSTTFYTCKLALPGMVAQNHGRIINLADSGADHLAPWPEATPYMVGKTGVLLLSKSLAKRYAGHGITVNCVSPGILTNSTWKPGVEKIPAGRYANYPDITNAVLFLLRPESSYITGANLKVAGGWCM